MLIIDQPITPALRWFLERAADDGTPALLVGARFGPERLAAPGYRPDIAVRHTNGTELSDSEQRRVAGIVAADKAEPLRLP